MHMTARSLLLRLGIVLALFLSMPTEAFSQGRGQGGPPPWAPAHGYRAKTRHIYFPQHNLYFDVQRGVYIFLNGGQWQVGLKLPSLYANLDLRRSTQIELELDNDSPHKFNADHKAKYKATPPGQQQAKPGGGPGGKPGNGPGNKAGGGPGGKPGGGPNNNGKGGKKN
jgi:hypothetical protein